MTFKYWDIKTVEEWYLLGKITEEEKRLILE
jgi:hypothetical protein